MSSRKLLTVKEEIDVPTNFKAKDLKVWKVTIPGDQDDQLRNLILQDNDELLAIKKISKYFPDSPPEEHIHIIVKLPRKCLVQYVNFRHMPS